MRVAERGFSALLIPFIITVLFLVGAVVFGGWAYSKMVDYRDNVNAKINTAVAAAKDAEGKAKDAQFAEEEKRPLRTYTGPAAYGSIKIQYPKTWSAYIADDSNGSPFVNGYFYPDHVPDIQSRSSAFALRVQIVDQSYSVVLSGVEGFVQQGKTKVTPYAAAKVPSIVGSRIDGELPNQKNGSMIVLPLRNTTLELWTEAPSFQNDFDTIILPNFSFSP
ncbi:MAG TPA: hypothetical protein VHC98_03235 [Candidatus Saccharimonadales bacterium]|nr:hypothetical protein [Candidatus Saccharimonadales bacterium]